MRGVTFQADVGIARALVQGFLTPRVAIRPTTQPRYSSVSADQLNLLRWPIAGAIAQSVDAFEH